MTASENWQVFVSRKAQRTLRRLPRDVQQRLISAVDDLASNPRPAGCRKLVASDDLYRVRVGDWRIIYAIEDAELVILIVNIASRGSAYRGL